MKNRLLLLVPVLVLSAIVLLLLLVSWIVDKKRGLRTATNPRDEILIEADTTAEIGDIALELSMDYAKLKSLLREKEQPRSHTKSSLTNGVVLRWDRGVTATFLGDDPKDDQKPVGIKIFARGGYPKFQASICGVRLRDSLEQASEAMRDCGCRVTQKHFKSGTWYVDVEANCRGNQELNMHFEDGRIASVGLWDKRYVVRPLDW